jgi:hypothetical protein
VPRSTTQAATLYDGDEIPQLVEFHQGVLFL